MRFLSVAERELRAAARHKGLYHLRWLTAAGAFVLLIWLGWTFSVFQNKRAGPEVFQILSTVIFLYCLFVGAAGTADCISRERRDGTLGLLFLTNLNSAEIVAGKFLSNGLALIYSLLAIFPILALPVLIGGITFGEFWRTVLALVGGLSFAIAAGFTASSVCVRQFPAVSLATGLTLAWSLGLVGLAEILPKFGLSRSTAQGVALFSPLHALLSANESVRMFRPSQYWFSLAAVMGLSWTWLVLVAWRIGRTWQDRPKSIRWWSRLRLSEQLRQRSRAARTELRRRLLEINPFFWLAARHRVSAPVFMGLTIVLVLLTVTVTTPFFGRVMAGTSGPIQGHLFAWVWTGLAIHGLVLYYGATVASQRLAEDKQSGALELILSTPATTRSIFNGLWLAYGRRMFFPALIAVLAHSFFIWQILTLMVLDPPGGKLAPGATPGQIFWSAIFDLPLQGQVLDWQFGFILRGVLFSLAALVASWLMIGWVGRWLGLRMKHPGFAPMIAAVLAVAPSALLFGLLCYVCDQFHLFRMPERQIMPLMLWIALGIALGNCLLWSMWAAGHLRRDFRTTVTSRYEPPALRDWWRAGRRLALRFTAAAISLAVILLLLVLAYYGYQNWKTQQRWATFQKQLQQRGESLDLSPILPGPVPAGQNFAQSPAFQNILNLKSTDKTAVALLRESLEQSRIDPVRGGGPALVMPWMRQTNASFDPQLAWINPKLIAGAIKTRERAADDVWEGMLPLQEDLSALAQAAQLPFFQATTNQNAHAVYASDLPPLAAMEQLNFLFQLRACALLALDRAPEAGADVLTGLRLAQLARQSPDVKSSMRVQVMLARTVQPVWEGLAKRRWSEAQLLSFQSELARFDLLSDYTNAIHRVVLACVATWQAIPDAKSAKANVLAGSEADGGQTGLSWQPKAWWYANCIQLHQAGQHAIARVDFANGRLTDNDDWGEVSGLPLDDVAVQLFEHGSWWGNSPTLVSVAQTSVNQAVIACALERHRQANGAYPESLDSLVPTYLNRIPRDISRGRPMYYQRTNPNSYVLRGAGPDGNIAPGLSPSDDWLWSFTPATNAAPAAVIKRR